jgi:dinuclear metal center YbgI/SA1388 family protein
VPALRQVLECLDRLYDPARAADWDAVGLVCGDPDADVRRILFAVDPVSAVADEAVEWRADLLVTHHPLFLTPVHEIAATTPKGSVVHRLLRSGVALQVCHTNADVASPGVSDALGAAIGVQAMRPIDPLPAAPLDKLATFVPLADTERVIDALAAAGAGAIGAYDRCSFATTGTGTFRPRAGATPAIGRIGEVARVEESRVEMVLPRYRRSAVLSALRTAHPYEEPAYDLLELVDVPADVGSGRVGAVAPEVPLSEFAQRVARALPRTAAGVRVSGDPDQQVATVAVCGGAGDSLLDAVRGSAADVYVTSDLRHHRASEFREYAHLAVGSGVALVDVSHWAAEWTWLDRAADRLRAELGDAAATVELRVSSLCTDPWAWHVPQAPQLMSKENAG